VQNQYSPFRRSGKSLAKSTTQPESRKTAHVASWNNLTLRSRCQSSFSSIFDLIRSLTYRSTRPAHALIGAAFREAQATRASTVNTATDPSDNAVRRGRTPPHTHTLFSGLSVASFSLSSDELEGEGRAQPSSPDSGLIVGIFAFSRAHPPDSARNRCELPILPPKQADSERWANDDLVL